MKLYFESRLDESYLKDEIHDLLKKFQDDFDGLTNFITSQARDGNRLGYVYDKIMHDKKIPFSCYKEPKDFLMGVISACRSHNKSILDELTSVLPTDELKNYIEYLQNNK